MKRLFGYVGRLKWQIVIASVIKVIGTALDLVIPLILAHILNDIVPTGDLGQTVFWGVLMIAASVFALLLSVFANRAASGIASDCTQRLRHDLFARISYLSSGQVDEITIASLESRLTVDTYNVNQMIAMSLRLGIRAPILFVGGIVMAAVLDWRLTLVLLATLPFLYFVVYKSSKAGIPLYILLQKKTDDFTRVVREDTAGIRVIKALSKGDYENARFDAANRDAITVEKKAGITMAKINPLTTFILNAGMCAVIAAGAFFVSKELSQAGTVIAFLSYFTIIASALINISRIFVNISKGAASMKRIDDVLSQNPALRLDKEDLLPDRRRPFLEFSHVSFSYGKTKVLDDISFTLEKGETLGIIGGTGVGKSTILQLLMRFYDTDEGEILIEGVNVKNIPTKTLRRRFGVVFQNDFLFADSIRENINFGRDLPDAAIEAAAKDASAADFIAERPGGMDAKLAIKGADLSGGQKQRLLIARALAARPEILVLDDASSALDYKTDANVRRAIAAHFAGTTTVIVAQRVSAIAHANRILVIADGRIIGDGNHEALLASCPVYREISQSQMGGAILD